MSQVGADTGGTFTDVVTADGRSAKVLSRPGAPARAVAEGLAVLRAGRSDTASDRQDRPDRPELLAHGTTVATNALLERRGAAVCLVTTQGLGDVIEIARQDRPSLYDQLADRPEPLVPRHRRHEVPGRLAADGRQLEPVDLAALADGPTGGCEVVAVCLLHADLDPVHERLVAGELRRRGFDVTCSHEVSPEMREYERTVTTVVNATLRPTIRDYLQRLADVAGEVLVMTSAGGLLPAVEAAELPAALLLSGPAGGARAGAAAAVANGFPDAVTFDMGGTSTDVCLILDGAPAPAAQREVGGFTVRFPALDIHTIGAGGGSIARLDAGGALVVGPESAGAEPGPACYGRGGDQPTVTDANLVAARIPADVAFGGLRLDRAAAEAALARSGITADGVLAVVNANMERALRAVSVERGVDPRGLALVAFGGAGPLHAAALAEALGMAAVVVPDRAGVLSAVGLLTAPRRRDLVRSWPTPEEHGGLDKALAGLADEAAGLVSGTAPPTSAEGGRRPEPDARDDRAGVTVEVALDCRYRGQSHELTVPADGDDPDGWRQAFHAEHRRRNGYERPEQPIEVVALRATVQTPPVLAFDDLPVARGRLDSALVRGPRVLSEPDCTVWVPPGWVATPGAAGALVLRREGDASGGRLR